MLEPLPQLPRMGGWDLLTVVRCRRAHGWTGHGMQKRMRRGRGGAHVLGELAEDEGSRSWTSWEVMGG